MGIFQWGAIKYDTLYTPMYIFALSLLLSCQVSSESNSIDDTGASAVFRPEIALLTSSGPCSVLVESLGDGRDVVSISPHEWIQQKEASTFMVNQHQQTEDIIESVAYDAERLNIHQTILALDGEIFLMTDGALVYSPINDVLPVPIQQVKIIDDSVWLLGAGRLFRWNKEEVREVSVHSASNILNMTETSSGTLAIATPRLEMLELMGDTLQLQTVPNLLPISTAATYSNRVLVSEGDSEVHLLQQDVWTRFEVDGVGQVLQLMSDPHADLVWIQGTDTSAVYDRGSVCTLDTDVNGEWSDVDELGRLIVVKDEAVFRYSLGQPVAVVGMLPNEQLDITREIFFLPTLEESVSGFSVWVGTERLDVNQESNSTVLNPEDFDKGTHTLRMVVEQRDGTSITEFPFVIGELSETSWEDVEPIYLDNCTGCHHESALIPLDTIQLWQQNIDLIIEEVSAQTMPLGAPPLTEEDILVIRGWKQGGFQE